MVWGRLGGSACWSQRVVVLAWTLLAGIPVLAMR